jgi:enterochelin esterase family protein
MRDRLIWTIVIIILCSFNGSAQTAKSADAKPSSPRISVLQNEVQKGSPNAVTRFWDDVRKTGTPLIEPVRGEKENVFVTFLWRGLSDTRNVVVFSQATGINPADNQMSNIDGTDVWYRTYRFRRDARFLYSLGPNDDLTPLNSPNIDWQKRFANIGPDPLNPKQYPKVTGRQKPQSVAEMPGAPAQLWVAQNKGTPGGKLEEQKIESRILKNQRSVWVYLPSGYTEKAAGYPLLVLFDGREYLDQFYTPTVLDNLIASGKIPPTVAILVDNLGPAVRDLELPCYRPFADFLASELLPWARDRYRVTSDPGATVVAGSSYGGLAATCAAMWYPKIFGNFLSQSASYWWKPDTETEYEWPRRQFASRDTLPLRAFITVGLMETLPKPGNTDQVKVNRAFRDALKAKGYDITYTEFNGAHEYIDWQGTLPDGLIVLLGTKKRQ